jgi:hypothetical protein
VSVFGADFTEIGPGGAAAQWLGGSPEDAPKAQQRRSGPVNKKVAWARRVNGDLKRERQQVTEEMRRATNMARGSTPWWRERPKWKIGTVLQYPATVPLTWTAILCDAKPSVTYTALDRSKQKRADIATAAWNQAYVDNNWEQTIHDTVLCSRVQKVGYLRLTFDALAHGGKGKPKLTLVLGEQVYLDKNARNPDDAEILMYEYRESYGSLIARFPKLRKRLARKYDQPRSPHEGENQSVLSPTASYTMPASAGGQTYYTPAYAASPNPPDSASGSSGILIREYWTRPHKTIEVDEVQFLTSGEPATQPKLFETADPADEEPLRRIVTEGGVIYELPESLVSAMYDWQDNGGIKIVSDHAALEAIKHKVKYPLYPQGRLMTVVDEDIDIDDRMNPLGYFPFVQIAANSDPGGGQYGPSDVDLIADPYEQLVRLVSIVYDTANLTGNSIWRIPIGAEISNDDITNAPGAIQREDLMCLKLGKREPAPQLPNYIPMHIKFLVDQIKELSGLSDVMLGKMPPKMQISTDTMTQGQEASGVRFRDALSNVSRAMRTLGEQFLELMARFYTSPVIVQIKNDAGVPEPVPMLGAYLTDPFIVEAKAGSRQPAGPTARMNTLLNLKNAGVPLSLDTIFELLEELGSIPSATGALRLLESQMADPKQRWKVLGLPVPGGQKNQSKKPGSKKSKKQGAAAG